MELKYTEYFRRCIHKEVAEIRENILIPFVCPLCGSINLDKKNIHIDHWNKPFNEVLRLFEQYIRNKYKLSVEGYISKIKGQKDGRREFIEFHNKNTHLRAICAECNQSSFKSTSDFHTKDYNQRNGIRLTKWIYGLPPTDVIFIGKKEYRVIKSDEYRVYNAVLCNELFLFKYVEDYDRFRVCQWIGEKVVESVHRY